MTFCDYKGFYNEAKSHFSERITNDFTKRFCYGIDASCFSYIPEIVIKAWNEDEIKLLFKLSLKYNTPLSFRAAGTSLCGQSSSYGVLVYATTKWENIDIQDNATTVKLDCGVIGANANEALKSYKMKIGPDPATINNAMIGGIFSNNSSGMCCGVAQNSYNTIESIRVILQDGTVLDTSKSAKKEESFESFMVTHKELCDELMSLREEILKDWDLTKSINRKFAIKNTTGYSINSLVDFEQTKDILNHIFIGAEGTLGFVSKVEYQCVKDFEFKACSLIFFEDINTACECVKILRENSHLLSSAEIMDYGCLESLKSHSKKGEMPDILYSTTSPNCTVLIQLESDSQDELDSKCQEIKELLSPVKTLFGVEFSTDEKECALWWKLRKGILPICATTRAHGTTVITEDICFETQHFSSGLAMLLRLFKKYDFVGIIFGHALSGNVHFIITPNLDDETQMKNFANFMDEMVDETLLLNGSTKAEHGTGRMMAPFVEKEWGSKAYAINKKIKNIFDKKSLINPDVIICEDKNIHLKNIKPQHIINDLRFEILNTCMECGFCEKNCPTKDFTITPRQRISLFREVEYLTNLKQRTPEQEQRLKEFSGAYDYLALQTCASCSMCNTSCPIGLDAGIIATNLLRDKYKILNSTLPFVSKHFGAFLTLGKIGLSALKFVNSLGVNSQSFIPLNNAMPKAKSIDFELLSSKNSDKNSTTILYFSSCINRMMSNEERSIQDAFFSLCQKAGVNIIIPKDLNSLCCSKAFKSVSEAKDLMIEQLKESFSQHKELKVICDHSACSYELQQVLKDEGFEIEDLVKFSAKTLLPKLNIKQQDKSVAIYAVCSLKKSSEDEHLYMLANKLFTNPVKHTQTQCCGFAGDKGFLYPKMNTSALERLSEFYATTQIKEGYSSSSSCEIGLNKNTDIKWRHIIYALDEATI